MPIATRRSIRLHWELSGNEKGPPLLLIRGLSRSSRYWYDLRPLLEPTFRVLVMDNRGVGRSSAPGPGFGTADMADDCAAVLDTLGGIRTAGTSIPLVYELLSSCHLALGHWESATAAAKEGLSRGIESSALHRDLGVAALREGKPVEAEREFRVALALDEANVVAHHQLGDALRAQKRAPSASSRAN